ncbi:MAG TPA: HlyD family efflux transporter periplasmic adaptor subunit [Alphaproteobacteria bacterium]|nr:HlyD family efflux transporter periplasmic adaptor subunit [Micavibrio sp.]HRK98244.1 HlyD family efflux transporter periplasmic adaptor subunit [Alphaproteobacteria bacterium]
MSALRFAISIAIFVCSMVAGVFVVSALSPVSAEIQSNLSVGALGWIEPKSRVIKIGAPNLLEGARVDVLKIEEGDKVHKGQVLGFFSTHQKNSAAYDVAQASLELAQANLKKVQLGSKQSDIISQEQIVQSLRASEEAAYKEFIRMETLYKEQLAAKSSFDLAKAHKDNLVAKRKSAEATLASLKEIRPDDVVIAEAQVKVSQSELAVAKANLELSTIVAPIDGEVLTIYSRNSEAVGDFGVLDMANLDVIDVVAEIDETDIINVQKGKKAEVFIPGMDIRLNGIVRDIGGQIKRNNVLDSDNTQILDTRIIEVRIELDSSKNEIVRRLINKKVRVKILP